MAGRHIQTVIDEGQFRILKMLALQEGVPLRDLLRKVVYDYITTINKEKEDGEENNCRR